MPKGSFPESCCQSFHSRGGSLLAQASTGDPPTLAGSFGSVSCGVIAPFLWVLVCTRFCLCPSRLESLFPPVLWKFCDQIRLPFKVSFPEVSQSPCQSLPRLGSLTCGSKLSQQWENFFGIIVLQFVGHPSSRYGILFYHDYPLLPSCWGLFFVFGHGVSSFSRFQHPPVDGCSTVSCDFGALAGDECLSFYSAILNQKKQNYLVFNCEEITQSWNGVNQHFQCTKPIQFTKQSKKISFTVFQS